MKQEEHYQEILGLVARIGRLTNPQHLARDPAERISLTQFLVLDALRDASAPLRMSSLADGAGLPPSELSRVVRELAGQGCVSRHDDPEDSRARLIAIAPGGKRRLRRAERHAAAELREVWSDLTHDEWHQFIDLLRRFERGLVRVRSDGDARSKPGPESPQPDPGSQAASTPLQKKRDKS